MSTAEKQRCRERLYPTRGKIDADCFDLIRKREGCAWSDMAYIGDNPAKDFVNLNPLGVLTVCVATGEHATVVAPPSRDAKVRIATLAELPHVLNEART